MTVPELIKKIRDDLNEISTEKSNHDVQSIIHGITRSINRLAMKDEKNGKLLRKYAVDLMQAYTAEVQFHNLNVDKTTGGASGNMRLSDGFFKSFNILKADIIAASEKF